MITRFRPMTKPQRNVYWRAHRAACFNLGLHGHQAQDDYRKRVMREECGKESISEMNTTTDFDAVLHRFCVDAGDFEMAAKFAIADTHRQAVLIKILCCQIMQLKGHDTNRAEAQRYLGGVLDQSRIANGRNVETGTYWLDVAPVNLGKLMAILDTYRRRIITRLIEAGKAVDTLTFFPKCRYCSDPYNRLQVDDDYYNNLADMRVNVL